MNKEKHKYRWYLIIGGVLIVTLVMLYGQRRIALSNAISGKLEDLPRDQEAVRSEFYSAQLTGKEKEVYDFLRTAMEELQGGALTLPKPVNGAEYMRIVTALENDGYNAFYGLYDIPMTAGNVYVKKTQEDLVKISDASIEKLVLFLSCAEGLELKGNYAEDGTVTNLEEVNARLSVNSAEGIQKIRDLQEKTEQAIAEILSGLPAEYGEKRAVDYFLNWMDETMTPASGASQTEEEVTGLGQMFDSIYKYNHLSCAAEQKGTALGYAKLLAELCQRAGMEAHIVIGQWKDNYMSESAYVLCAVQMNGQPIYVDACGAKSSMLGGERYLTQREAVNHMEFVDYFSY